MKVDMREEHVGAIALLTTITLACLALFLNQSSFIDFPYPREPLFLGYYSNSTRIEPVKLDELKLLAIESGYEVASGRRGMDADYVDIYDYPVAGCYFQIVYSPDMAETYFGFTYPDRSNASDWLWETLRDTLNVSDARFEEVKSLAISGMGVDGGGAHIGTTVDGVKPDFAALSRHLCPELGRENDGVGFVRVDYGERGYMLLMADALAINVDINGNVTCVVNIDGDSDVCLYVDSAQKLEEPLKYFREIFDTLRLPNKALNNLKLGELWAGCA